MLKVIIAIEPFRRRRYESRRQRGWYVRYWRPHSRKKRWRKEEEEEKEEKERTVGKEEALI